MVRSYEKMPRKMARTEEKEVIHLLPIKDKTGIIPQSVERGTACCFQALSATFIQTQRKRVKLTQERQRNPADYRCEHLPHLHRCD